MTTTPPRILLGVTGSVAAHRALDLTSEWTKAGREVDVLLTKAAQEFIRPLAFQALSRRKVFVDLFEAPGEEAHDHIRLAEAADLFVVAPCSADALARFAAGLCDDVLTTTLYVYRGPRLICPAMNRRMWENPITARNVATLRGLGFAFVDPCEGELACGDHGVGRLAPIADILARADALLR
ncbi:MAG TPA: flavoprotein [Planctomycetota bacterium]|nr:flavoprotein [Planctomycetota bacterium]